MITGDAWYKGRARLIKEGAKLSDKVVGCVQATRMEQVGSRRLGVNRPGRRCRIQTSRELLSMYVQGGEAEGLCGGSRTAAASECLPRWLKDK